MKLFKCTLTKNGYVKDLFYRQGDNKSDVIEGLNMFDWAGGNWEVEEVTA